MNWICLTGSPLNNLNVDLDLYSQTKRTVLKKTKTEHNRTPVE